MRGTVQVPGGGVAVGPDETLAGRGAAVKQRAAGFTPDQPAGWALYFALAAALFIVAVAYASTR